MSTWCYAQNRYVPKGQVAEEEWEKLKQKHEEEVKIEKEAREAQYKAEQEYQQLIAEEQAAYEAKRMGMPSTGAAPIPPVSSKVTGIETIQGLFAVIFCFQSQSIDY